MKLLAVETATEACSAALFIDGEIEERFQIAPREHTSLILPMMDSLMAEASISLQDLDAVAFGRGPGSFTGVRIATGVIHGVAFGLDLPVVPVSTLAAIAQDCFNKTEADYCFTAMDARMKEIYWAEYQKHPDGYAELKDEESVGPVEQIRFSEVEGFGAGSGWKVYGNELKARLQSFIQGYDASYLPRASCIASLGAVGFTQGKAVPVEQAMPVYLRDKVAKKESER